MDPKEELLIRHDERIGILERQVKDLARIASEREGYHEGWWQSRRDSFMEDIQQNLEVRNARTVKRFMWVAATAVIAAAIAVAKDYLLP